MGCRETYDLEFGSALEQCSLTDKEQLISEMGATILSVVAEIQPVKERILLNHVVEAHPVTVSDAAFALSRLGGSHVGDPIRIDEQGNVSLS